MSVMNIIQINSKIQQYRFANQICNTFSYWFITIIFMYMLIISILFVAINSPLLCKSTKKRKIKNLAGKIKEKIISTKILIIIMQDLQIDDKYVLAMVVGNQNKFIYIISRIIHGFNANQSSVLEKNSSFDH